MENKIVLLSVDNSLTKLLNENFSEINITDSFFQLIDELANKYYKIALIDIHEIPQFNENNSIKILNSISPITDIIIISKNKTYKIDYLQALYSNNRILSILNVSNDIDYLHHLINYSIERRVL